MVTVVITASDPSDPYSRDWNIYTSFPGVLIQTTNDTFGGTWTVDLPTGTYYFNVGQSGGSAYGTYSGAINGVPFSGVDVNNAAQFTVGGVSPPPSITVAQLEADRVIWEQANTNGQITYARYTAIYNAYLSLYYNLSSQSLYDAYNSLLIQTFGMGTPLNSSVLTPPTGANGKILGIRLQDILLQKWFNWDLGVGWSPSMPVVTPGAGNLYIAFWAGNQGAGGNLILKVKDDTGMMLASKSVYIAGGSNAGIEAINLDMPSRSYGINLEVTP